MIISEVFEETVEDALHGPIFVIDYPAAICPLTKRKGRGPRAWPSGSSCLVHGIELHNAYTD